MSRASNGVLFLDELAEFNGATLQALRQPLEQGRVVITRSGGSVGFPARFQLVAATNPCPCGWAGDGGRRCRCSPTVVDAYLRGLSGPLLDRIDLQVYVPRVAPESLGRESLGESSSMVRARALCARSRQVERQGMLNSALGGAQLRHWAPLGAAARRWLERWAKEARLSARAFHRAWRVARTLADLEDAAEVEERHVMEAIGYRLVDQAA